MRDPGAPVDLYRLLEAADEPELIDHEIPEGAEILELGSGSGRITHPLLALGRRVVAVDFNPEMLELIEGAETVLSRIEDLERVIDRLIPYAQTNTSIIQSSPVRLRAPKYS